MNLSHALQIYFNSFCEEVYVVAFFRVMQQQTIGKVANLITCLWADNFCLNRQRIIKIGQYLRKLCSTEKGSSFLTHSVHSFNHWLKRPWKIIDGVKVNGLLVKAMRFADDQAMVSSSNAGLKRIIDALNKTSKDYGMKINIKKTKVMRVCKTGGKKTVTEYNKCDSFCILLMKCDHRRL